MKRIDEKKYDNNEEKIELYHINKNADDIVIVGISVKMPLADSPDKFWINIKNGLDCSGVLPIVRQDDIMPYVRYKVKDDNIKLMKGSFLEDIKSFDYTFFGVSPKEANLMDPLQRLLLQSIYEAVEDSGMKEKQLKNSRTGIFLGATGDIDKLSYRTMVRDNNIEDCPIALTGNLLSMIPGKIAYALDLKGPSMVIDTACSSSLVAVHEACQKIKNGECNQAIVASGRIHIFPIEDKDKIGIESSDYVTRTFDDGADGSGFGEGIVSIILKPLQEALDDNNHIYAVIKGSATGQNGTSQDLTAPNPRVQEKIICEAWDNAKINPEEISYIECHGTATKLGDPIEIEALNRAFSRYTDKKGFCAVGSVKSNIGHLLECSGLAGLIKCILAMNHHELPPTIHFESPNNRISFIDGAVYVNKALQKWQRKKCICGVSSFGLSGMNCHLVLEQAPESVKTIYRKEAKYIFTLSAKTKEALMQFVKMYVDLLARCDEERVYQICYTTNTSKNTYEYKLALYCSNKEELCEKLQVIVDKGLSNIVKEGIFTSPLPENNLEEKIQSIYHNKKKLLNDYILLCKGYVNGIEIDWDRWYKDNRVQKVSVPLYPFEKKECWLPWSRHKVNSLENDRVEDYFYGIKWKTEKEVQEVQKEPRLLMGKKVVLLGKGNKQADLSDKLREKGAHVIEVFVGCETYSESGDSIYLSNYSEDFDKVLEYIDINTIDMIIHSVNSSEDKEITELKQLNTAIDDGFYSLFYLAKSICGYRLQKRIEIFLLTKYAYEVTGEEKIIYPGNAAFLGLGKNINLELSHCICRAIDVDDDTDIDCVIKHITCNKSKYVTALRCNSAFYEEFNCEQIDEKEKVSFSFKDGGAYIITGGLGNIGLKVAEYIAEHAKTKIIILSRREFPERAQWNDYLKNDKFKDIITRLICIEKKGSEISFYQTDISNEDNLSKVMNEIQTRYSVINGIVHAAGVTGNGFIVNQKEEVMNCVLSPKIQGTWLLDKCLAKQNLDFFLVFSSGVSLIGEIGLGDYTAANAYLDSFARMRNKTSRTISINWVVWKNARMGEGYLKNVDGIFNSIESDMAIKCLDKVLNHKVNQVLIGSLNYESKYAGNFNELPFFVSPTIQERVHSRVLADLKEPERYKEIKVIGNDRMSHSKIEVELSQIVGNALGVQEVNIYDNFFEMGITSIILNKIYEKVNMLYPDKLMVSDFFAYSSIHKLSEYIYANMEKEEKSDEDKINKIISKIQNTDDIESLFEEL